MSRHRYNLKRKIAELQPVTAEVFAQKVLAQQDQLRLSASQANFSQTCVPCKKTFYSQNAYNNHLSSKRHRIASLRAANATQEDAESLAGSIGTVSVDMVGSVASLDDPVQAIDEGVDRMEIVDEEVSPFPTRIYSRMKYLRELRKGNDYLRRFVCSVQMHQRLWRKASRTWV